MCYCNALWNLIIYSIIGLQVGYQLIDLLNQLTIIICHNLWLKSIHCTIQRANRHYLPGSPAYCINSRYRVCPRSRCMKLISFSIAVLWWSCAVSKQQTSPQLQSLPGQYVNCVLIATMLSGGRWAMSRHEGTHCQIRAYDFCRHLRSLVRGQMRPNSRHCGNTTTVDVNSQEISFICFLGLIPIPGLDRDLVWTEYRPVMVRSHSHGLTSDGR